MGAYQNNAKADRKGTKSRGSTNNTSRLDGFGGGSKEGGAEWSSCDPERLHAVVVAITGLGGAITLGLSRDRGAHSLTLMLDNDRTTLWFNGDADLDAALTDVQARLDAMA